MGAMLSWLKSFWQQEMEISIIGLENAGKSTFVQLIHNNEFVPNMVPTVGFNMYKVNRGNVSIKVWDLGGQKQFRNMWERYCRKNDAIVFMIDSADPDKFPDARQELDSLISGESLAGIPLLVLCNKMDLDSHRPAKEIVEALALNERKDREVAYYEISCKTIHNIDVTLDWLIKHSK